MNYEKHICSSYISAHALIKLSQLENKQLKNLILNNQHILLSWFLLKIIPKSKLMSKKVKTPEQLRSNRTAVKKKRKRIP